jgi:hypothetical protein
MKHTVTREQLDSLVSLLDLEDEDVREDYSGRGMYGDTCLGFVTDKSDVRIGIAFAEVFGFDDAWDLSVNVRTDAMGRSSIVYFPGVKVEQA